MATDKTFVPFAAGHNFDSGIYDYESDTSFTSVDDSFSPGKYTKLLDLNTPSQSVKIDHIAAISGNSSSYSTDLDSASPMTNLLPSSYVVVPITVQVALLQVQFLSACSRNGRKKLDDLQTFYDLQSAQIESERFQLLYGNRSDERLCSSVNCYHDNEHRQLIKMVEKSLGLLQDKRNGDVKTSTSTTRVPPDGSATQHLADWFEENRNHPYPTPAVKYRMAEEGNMSIAQVNKWFSNRRVRSGSADGNASKRRRC